MISNQKFKKYMKSAIKRIGIATFFSLAIIATSCTIGLSGESVEETRDVKNFSIIELSIPADLYLTQGDGYSFKIEGDKDFLKEVRTEVNGKSLKIKTDSWINFGWKDLKVKIYITMPNVEGLTVAGSGDIQALTPIKAQSLFIRVSGSGDVSIPNLEVQILESSISGSGDVTVSGKGTAQEARVRISGSGDVDLKGIRFANVDVSISGSGDAYIEASENLKARVVGSGDIVYSGNPLIDAKVTGSGTIKNK
jgi:hypothetical protein